ncbi:MAG TPA: periplasmic heavy metal sensor [Caulobacterales bacterium]|nr:periplasmic heavy metal sensor [Caulobacterales bacterium]
MSRFPWRTLLFISVAFNLLLIGVGVGIILRGEPVTAAGGARLTTPRAIMAALPADARRPLRARLIQAWRESRDQRAEVREASAEVIRLLRADTYDANTMRQALARQRTAMSASTATFHDAAADAFTALTPAQRRAVADALVSQRVRFGDVRLRQRLDPDSGDAP